MISLPQLRITRSEYAEVSLLEKARLWLEKEDETRLPGIHASDLLDPRLGYFQAVNPKPLSERQIWLFLVGRILHYFILSTTDPSTREAATDSGAHKALDVLFSPDLLKDGAPIEVKTNRSIKEPDPDNLQESISDTYLEQLCIYLVLCNRLVGELWILFLNLKDATNRTFPEPRCYRIELTKDQFYLLEQQVLATRDALIEAKEKRDHKLLPPCRDWKCGLNCAWWEDCRPEGRWPEKDKRRWKA